MHRLAATVARVAVFRPITRLEHGDTGSERDYILELLLGQATAGLSYEECAGVSYQQLHEDPEAAIAEIVDRFHHVADRCDAVLVVGSDYTDVAAPSELSMNARIAVNLGASVVLAVKAQGRTPTEVAQVVEVCLAELAAQHAHTAAVVANRCDPEQLTAVADALSALGPKSYVLPEEPLLVAPSVAELRDAVHGELTGGDEQALIREAMSVLVAGMTAEHVLERLKDGMAVITPGDRSDVVMAVMGAHAAAGFPSLSCLILNGGLPLHPEVARLVAGLGARLPIISTDLGTYDTARAVASARGRVTVDSQRKVDTALALMEQHVDTADLIDRLSIPIPSVTTPQMFTYQLIDQARADVQRIVLPEGDDDRILRAAGRLLAHRVAELTILGDEPAVRARAAELGVDLSAVTVLDPRTSELCDLFAEQYAQLRSHKGVTVDQARETISDVSYFGTMLVHNDMVDGMVSGARHTTAHTVRPAFEIIKTKPGVSTVSSIFLMCLEDRVLAYGDCAIVPDPTSEQLADIAISSAGTAAQFGIDPRVAMLSYSTGSSGTGADVDKVRAATELVRQRAPELLVEGPIQYDAAVDPSTAQTKMPDSDVAGRATVLIFPDLNTGNNTYKAVQRSAGAIAIGPVLQGLNKPVNDLSRGALVEDIVNTVAITAIQAGRQ
jgi:phosphate acetyltransferase